MIKIIKTLLVTAIILLFYGCTSNKFEQFKKTDQRYKNQIIGTWVVDTERQEAYIYPGYIEYFKDGTSRVHFFEDNTCEKEFDLGSDLWRIYNGVLYYKGVDELEWSEDKIVEFTDTHHILISQGKTIYRKRGIVCKNQKKKGAVPSK